MKHHPEKTQDYKGERREDLQYSIPPERSQKLLAQPLLRFLLISLLILGLVFRVVTLDSKLYWGDEVFTSMQISGHSLEQMKQVADGQVISVRQLQTYQYPQATGSVIDPVRILALEDSQHVPLYYMLLWTWVRIFGNSIAVIRSFSVVLSLLALGWMYWLSRELFRSNWIAWVATALIAVSPFHILYAQEARPYSLFILMTLVSGTAFLRALRLNTGKSWAAYAIATILGLYTHIFFSIVLAGHGAYLLVIDRFKLRQSFRSYLIAMAIGLLSFSPWLWIIIHASRRFDAVSWANTKQSFLAVLVRWSGILSRSFVDLGVGPDSDRLQQIGVMPLVLGFFLLTAYAFWVLIRTAPQRIWLFITFLTGLTLLAFAIPDFILGLRYATTRFLTPSILGIQLAIAYLLATQLSATQLSATQLSAMSSQSLSAQPRRAWQAIAALVLSIEILSCILISSHQIWWNKAPERNLDMPATAAQINRAERPLVISDDDIITIQVLGHLLEDHVKLQLVKPPVVPEVQSQYSEIFVFKSSNELRSKLQQQYVRVAKPVTSLLWQL